MKSVELIKTLLPITNALQRSGCFNQPLVNSIEEWTKRFKEAAIADKIDNSQMVNAIEKIRSATDFELQQAALLALIETMHQQIDDIPAGKLPVYVPPLPTMSEVMATLRVDINSTIDQFTVANDVETRMRQATCNLYGLVTGAVLSGEVPKSAINDMEIVVDAINYAGDEDFRTRNSKMIVAQAGLDRLAA